MVTAVQDAPTAPTLPTFGPLLFQFGAYGDPISQGSKKAVGKTKQGRTILVESSKRHKPWRATTSAAARRALPDGWVPIDGPLIAEFRFTLKPPAAKRTILDRLGMPTAYPDVSKLVRSVEDAMSDAEVWADDARVVFCLAEKRYVGDPDAEFSEPGVFVRVWQHPGRLL